MQNKKTLVIGASPKPERYSYKAVKMLTLYGHEVVALAKRDGVIEGTPIQTNLDNIKDIHTVTLYLRDYRQKEYYDFILHLKPKRIIFNPGTENNELKQLAQENGIEVIEACTLVMLSSGIF